MVVIDCTPLNCDIAAFNKTVLAEITDPKFAADRAPTENYKSQKTGKFPNLA